MGQRPIDIVSIRSVLIGLLLVAAAGVIQAADIGDHPDLSGLWADEPLILPSSTDGTSVCIFNCDDFEPTEEQSLVRRPPERPKYRPEVQAKVDDLNTRQVEEDSVLRCMPPGVPRIGPPDQIVQGRDMVVFLYEDPVGGFYRAIPLDGRGHREGYDGTFLGDPTGSWDGDTLVVETLNFSTDTWLTDDGSFHTSDLRVIERLRKDGDNILYDVTAYDPAVLVEPWIKKTRTLTPMSGLLYEPSPCIDDMDYQQDLTNHDNPR